MFFLGQRLGRRPETINSIAHHPIVSTDLAVRFYQISSCIVHDSDRRLTHTSVSAPSKGTVHTPAAWAHMAFHLLPADVGLLAFSFLPADEVYFNVSRVCRHWHELSVDDSLWAELTCMRWELPPPFSLWSQHGGKAVLTSRRRPPPIQVVTHVEPEQPEEPPDTADFDVPSGSPIEPPSASSSASFSSDVESEEELSVEEEETVDDLFARLEEQVEEAADNRKSSAKPAATRFLPSRDGSCLCALQGQ